MEYDIDAEQAAKMLKDQGGLDALNAILGQLSNQIDTLHEILEPVLGPDHPEADVPHLIVDPPNKLRGLSDRGESISRRLSKIIDRIDL